MADNLVGRLWSSMTSLSPFPKARPFDEMGGPGTAILGGRVQTRERNANLIGARRWETFSDILANTAIVSAGTRYFLNVISRPNWSCEAADDSDEAQRLADFVEEALHDMLTPWNRIVRRAGLYRFHGFSTQEWTAKRLEGKKENAGKINFLDISVRPQYTIERWEIDEKTGKIVGVWQRDAFSNQERGIPRSKLLYLVDDTFTDDPEGLGLLRHVAQPVARLNEYLEQEGTGFLRDLRGIPIGRAPLTELQKMVEDKKITKADMDAMVDALKEFTRLEKKTKDTGLVLNSQNYKDAGGDQGPQTTGVSKWGLELVTGAAPGLEAVGAAVQRLNHEIARVLGVEALLLGSDGSGSLALGKEKTSQMYLMANSMLTDIRYQVQQDLIEPLWALNGFPDDLKPRLKTEDVSPRDVEMVARVLQSMASAGTPLQPDDEVQNFIRDLLGAPHVDLDALTERMDAQQEAQMAALMASQGQKPGEGEEEDGDTKAIADESEDQKLLEDMRAARGKRPGSIKPTEKYFRELAKNWDVRKYDPDQPRADDGKWTAGGGNGKGRSGAGRQRAGRVSGAGRSSRGKIRSIGKKVSRVLSKPICVKTVFRTVGQTATHLGVNIAHRMATSIAVSTALKVAMPHLGGGTRAMAAAAVAFGLAEILKASGLDASGCKDLLLAACRGLTKIRAVFKAEDFDQDDWDLQDLLTDFIDYLENEYDPAEGKQALERFGSDPDEWDDGEDEEVEKARDDKSKERFLWQEDDLVLVSE